MCLCGSEKNYPDCCGKYHQGELPETALQLMRSRYTAYAMDNPDYIITTTHPKNPGYRLDRELWTKEIHAFSQGTQFEKLDILDFTPGEKVAYVTFKAHLTQNGQDASFTERSRFEKVDGRWLYHSGIIRMKDEG